MKITRLLQLFFILSIIIIPSCDDNEVQAVDPGEVLDLSLISFEAATFSEDEFIIYLTEDPAGKIFSFGPGTYNFTNTIPLADIDSLTIKGAGINETYFDFSNSTSTTGEGIAAVDCSNLLFCGFTIQNTNGGNGITARNITGLRFDGVGTVWPETRSDNGAYGIYPVESDDVIVENCYTQGAVDAGIYSGQNQRVIMRNNVMTLNVFGMEAENNIHVEIYGNEFTRNTTGLLVYDNNGVSRILSGSNCKVYDNTFTNNNESNFADLGSSLAADVPPGFGILYSATSALEITGNSFVDNECGGIIGVAYYLVDFNFDPNADSLFTFLNDDIYIHDNSFSSGGGTYNVAGILDRPAGPLVWYTFALNGNVRPDIFLDQQDYTAGGAPYAGTRAVIEESSDVIVLEANFVEAGNNIVNITSTSLEDFAGTGVTHTSFDLVDTPSECEE
jgi:parallel beta-helix repeat protein